MIGDEQVTEEQATRARRGYYGAVSLVDDHLGALLEHAGEDTIVVFTSDHGDMLGERGLWYKMAPFEDSIRVPLVAHAPERFPAGRVAEPVSLLDVAPTIAALAGGALEDVDGRALLRGDAPARDIAIEYLAEGVRAPQVTIVRGPRKIIRSYGEPDLVYDVESDPAERIDLAAEPEAESLREAVDARWDLPALDAAVRLGQRRRRLVAAALAEGDVAKWDHPEGRQRYIDTGDDFWTTLERARRP
jgi:choline-sulfatase